MTGNCHVRFLGEAAAEMPLSYPTEKPKRFLPAHILGNAKRGGEAPPRFALFC